MGPILLCCANCGMSPLVLFRVSTWFALFFIPVIPVSFKHYTACPNCKRFDQVSKADVERARAQESAVTPGHDVTAGTSSQPATLEHAVNEWAMAAPGPSVVSGAGPAFPPASFPVTESAPTPPAGWYPDPAGGSNQRYWDGERWRSTRRPHPRRLVPGDRRRCYLPFRSRWSHPGQQQGRRIPSSNSSWVRRMRRSRVLSCLAFSTQQMNSLRARGVMSFQATSAVGFVISASRRSVGSLWTTPPGTRVLLTAQR
jgi:Protein of unknown function (DUF2510)/zinc-ribbon family